MRKSALFFLGVCMLSTAIAGVPSPSWATALTIDQIIYQPSTGLDPAMLSASATATISGSTLMITLTNTSLTTGGESSGWLLTGIGFELPEGISLTNTAAYVSSGSSGYYKIGSTPYSLGAGDNLRGEWGGGAAEGPFVDVTTLNVDYVAATLQSAFASGNPFDPAVFLKNPVGVNGPEFGLLSGSFTNAGGLGYIQDSITLVWSFSGTLSESDIENGNVVVSFGSPTAVPEPHTLLLLGSGLLAVVGFGRKFRK